MGALMHALLTMRKIDAMIEADQGASFRGWEGKVLPHIGDAYRDDPEDGHRPHLGASILGGECPRAIYYSRSEEHTSELQSLMRISYAVFCLNKNKKKT